jgi:hypothetical protein
MDFKNHAILSMLALLTLSACDNRASPSYSPTLSKLGPNMQEVMEQALQASGSWNMQPKPNSTEANELHLKNL